LLACPNQSTMPPGQALRRVFAPTLLLVGGDDRAVLPLNQAAWDELPGEKELVVVPGAGHLFEEPGALEQVAELAREWFERFLVHEAGRAAPPPV
jgi:pimeloyl-ACP methyl ester carboxylesterase